jgi:hypothetical protein
VEAPKGRRDEFVEMTAIGDKRVNRWHLQIADRCVVQHNFYVNDRRWGRMFVRMCPLSAILRPGLPQSTSLVGEPHARGGHRLQAMLECLSALRSGEDLSSCAGNGWPISPRSSATGSAGKLVVSTGCSSRKSNLRQSDLSPAGRDKLGERLLDANRTIGQPNKITVIFGRKITKQHSGKLQTEIEDMHLPNPVIRSHYRNGFIKQYVRDHLILRTEAATNNVTDYGVSKAVEHLPALRDKLWAINDNYFDIQQDILVTFIDRGHLQDLAKPTLTAAGKRISGLKLDNPRQLALVRFAQIAAASTFSTGEIHPYVAAALGSSIKRYSLASLRYDFSKLRTKGLVEKLPRSRRYRFPAEGYSVCLIFLKLFDRFCAPLAAGLLNPVPGDDVLPRQKRSLLDRLYHRLTAALDQLTRAIGLPFSPTNENTILVKAPHRRVR